MSQASSDGAPRLTRASYREYIEELARWAEEDPKRYQMRVILLVLKGYAYILGVAVLLIVALGVVVTIAVMTRQSSIFVWKLILPLAVLAFIFLKALWPNVAPPVGGNLAEQDAPEIHGLVERVRARLGVPRPYAILGTADFNASIVQFPRFGFFGGYRSYVVLGLPLLEALAPDEFEAVLAHEFGHLAGEHGRFAAWIYRMRQSWGQILAQLEKSRGGLGLVRGFLRGFVPEFDATTFVLARRHEYEADRAAAEATDARTIASALIRIELMSRARGERLVALPQRVAREADPPADVLGEEIRMFRDGLDPETAHAWLKDALGQPTDLDDTHPALADRLAALGLEPETLPAATHLERSAAEAFAGPIRERWRRDINEAWLASNAEAWRTQNKALAQAREAHQEMKARAAAGSLLDREQLQYAESILEHEGIDAAIDRLRPLVNGRPGDHRSRRMLGDLLLARDDESGLENVMAVVNAEPALAVQSCQHAYQWLFRRGRKQEADEWFEREKFCMEAWERGRHERTSIAVSDEFLPHGLPEHIVDPIRSAMRALEGIQGAWLVRKRLLVIPDEPLWVFFIEPNWNWISFGRDKRAQKILSRMAATVPPIKPSLHVLLVPALAPIRRKLEAIESARLR